MVHRQRKCAMSGAGLNRIKVWRLLSFCALGGAERHAEDSSAVARTGDVQILPVDVRNESARTT